MSALRNFYERMWLASPWVPRWFHDEMLRRSDAHRDMLFQMLQQSNDTHVKLLGLLHAHAIPVLDDETRFFGRTG